MKITESIIIVRIMLIALEIIIIGKMALSLMDCEVIRVINIRYLGHLLVLLVVCHPSVLYSAQNILSDGDRLYEVSWNDDLFDIRIIDFIDYRSTILWPSFNQRTGDVYFERDNRIESTICKVSMNDSTKNVVEIVSGRSPSVSPTGEWLSFKTISNDLYVRNLLTGELRIVCRGVMSITPASWATADELLYVDMGGDLYRYNCMTKNVKNTGYYQVIPYSLSPDGRKVICKTINKPELMIYYPYSNELRVLKKFRCIQVGSSFVWESNSLRFFYTRQSFFSAMMPDGPHGLYRCTLDGDDKRLEKNFYMRGGFPLVQ